MSESKPQANALYLEESPDDIMTLVTYPQMIHQERYEFKKTLTIQNYPKDKSDTSRAENANS